MRRISNVLVVAFILGVTVSSAMAEDSEVIGVSVETTSEAPSTWETFRSKVRSQQYTEFMSPGFKSDGVSIPNSEGNSLTGTNLDGRLWVDYEVASNWRVLYWQRYIMAPSTGLQPFDPRVGIRRTQAFAIPNLDTTYDFYFLPGVSQFAETAGRSWSVGSRMNTSYSIPSSRFTVGLVTELTGNFYKSGRTGADFTAIVAPTVSYKLSSLFSTQTWFMIPFKHKQAEPWSQYTWDLTGMPFVQNGIGINASERVWIGVFVNNYLMAAPTAQNTWASLWLNVKYF